MGHPLDPSNPLDMGIFPRVPRDQWPQPRPVIPTPTLREMQMQAYQTGAVPRGGGRGWQTGGAVGYAIGGGVRPRPFPPIPPRGDPDRRIPPTPTLREMQMQAAHRGRGRGPGGWQAGGSVGRNMFNPRAAAAAAMIRNAPPPPREQQRIRFEGPNWPFPQGLNPDGTPYVSPLPPAPPPIPGGWSHGGGVGVGPGLSMNVIDASTPAGRRKARALGQYIGPIGVARTMSGEARERAANQARLLSRSPGGWQTGGDVDSTEALMDERDRLQQLLQTADEAMAQEIMAQIMEINKELEMEARNFGMAGGGVASLMGG